MFMIMGEPAHPLSRDNKGKACHPLSRDVLTPKEVSFLGVICFYAPNTKDGPGNCR